MVKFNYNLAKINFRCLVLKTELHFILIALFLSRKKMNQKTSKFGFWCQEKSIMFYENENPLPFFPIQKSTLRTEIGLTTFRLPT